jgi:hypothetical protein
MTTEATRPSVNRGHLTSVFSEQVTSALISPEACLGRRGGLPREARASSGLASTG